MQFMVRTGEAGSPQTNYGPFDEQMSALAWADKFIGPNAPASIWPLFAPDVLTEPCDEWLNFPQRRRIINS